MKIKVSIPEIEEPESIPQNRFYNNIVTYFLIHGLNFSVIERKKICDKTVQFRLNKLNEKLKIENHYSTISECIREMIINYILLSDTEKEKIIAGEFIEKSKN